MDNSSISLYEIIDERKGTGHFRINKTEDFSTYTMPKTKFNEEYLVIKQIDEKRSDIHYYIVSDNKSVIGSFDVSYDLEDKVAGITYHLIEQFQNRGIGKITLKFVVDDIFNCLSIDRIKIAAINERSMAIAVKNGFQRKSGSNRMVQLTREKWAEIQKGMNKGKQEERENA